MSDSLYGRGLYVFTGLSTDAKSPTSDPSASTWVKPPLPGQRAYETDTKKLYEFDTASWLKIRGTDSAGNSAGSVVVDGLANNAVRVVAGATYSATLTLGFRVLLKGAGTLTFTPNTSGATPIVITAAELTAMGASAYVDFPIAASSITAGTGMELMVYIP